MNLGYKFWLLSLTLQLLQVAPVSGFSKERVGFLDFAKAILVSLIPGTKNTLVQEFTENLAQ